MRRPALGSPLLPPQSDRDRFAAGGAPVSWAPSSPPPRSRSALRVLLAAPAPFALEPRCASRGRLGREALVATRHRLADRGLYLVLPMNPFRSVIRRVLGEKCVFKEREGAAKENTAHLAHLTQNGQNTAPERNKGPKEGFRVSVDPSSPRPS